MISKTSQHMPPANGEVVYPPVTDFSQVLVLFSHFHYWPFVVGLNMTNLMSCDFFIGRLNSLESLKNV